MHVKISNKSNAKFALCFGCLRENAERIKYLSNNQYTDEDIPDIIVNSKFGQNH